MPRGKKAANGADHDDGEQSPPEGHNGPSDALILDYARNIIRKDNEIEEAHDAHKSLVGQRRSQVKAAKKAGIQTDALLRVIGELKLDVEGVARQDREYRKYTQLLNRPLGYQFDIFSAEEVADGLDDEERSKQLAFGAEQLGYVAGKNGHLIDNNPFHQSDESEQFANWVNGWDRGQAHLAKGLTQPKTSGRRGRGSNAEDRPAA